MGQRKSQYMGIQPRTAPLHDRSDTQHQAAFRHTPTLDFHANLEVNANAKPKRWADAPNPYEQASENQAQFRPGRPEELAMARTWSVLPEHNGRILGGTGDSLVFASTMNAEHKVPHLGVKYAGSIQKPGDELCRNRGRTVCGASHVSEDMMRSSYHGHFGTKSDTKRQTRDDSLASAAKTAKFGETMKFAHSLSSPSLSPKASLQK